MRLAGKQAFITGGGSGIGRAVAVRLAAEGASLYLVGRNPAHLDEAAEASRAAGAASVARCPADLTDDRALDTIVANVLAAFDGLDILIHAAGGHVRNAVADADVADLDRLYRINLRVPFRLTQALLPSLAARQGDIVFVNSAQQGPHAAPFSGVDAATRHGLAALADSLRAEVSETGIRVLTAAEIGHVAPERPSDSQEMVQPADMAAAAVVAALRLPHTTGMSTIACGGPG